MEAVLASRARLRQLLTEVYSQCSKCGHRDPRGLLVLSCVHVVCARCALDAVQRAARAQDFPPALQPTRYHDPRRLQCPVCSWPIYRPLGTGENNAACFGISAN
ncbi:hypothetical protein ACOMHN_031302 [Nucella lapillus]